MEKRRCCRISINRKTNNLFFPRRRIGEVFMMGGPEKRNLHAQGGSHFFLRILLEYMFYIFVSSDLLTSE
ncbi:hypothetical protein QTP88_012213 [Uroleucon formosanum]